MRFVRTGPRPPTRPSAAADTLGVRAVSTLLACSILAVALPACRTKVDKPDIPRLMAELRSSDPQASGQGRDAAPAWASRRCRRSRRCFAPALADRIAAANTLWGMGEAGLRRSARAGGDARRSRPGLRVAVAMALQQNMGAVAAPAVPALTKAISGPRPARVRLQTAVKALGRDRPVGPRRPAGPHARAAPGSWPEAEEAVRRIGGLEPGAAVDSGPPSRSSREPRPGG